MTDDTKKQNLFWIAMIAAALIIGVLGTMLYMRSNDGGARPPMAATDAATKPETVTAPVEAKKPPTPPKSAMTEKQRYAAAVAAVFGSTDARTITVEGAEMKEKPARLIDTDFGPVLLTINTSVMDCHACAGSIGAYYLDEKDGKMSVSAKYPDAMMGWGWGAPPENWEVTTKFTRHPALYAEGGYMGQGYLSESAALVELTPQGPRSVTIALGSDDSGAIVEGEREPTTIEGKIVNIKRGVSFDVKFSGSCTETQRYKMTDGVFKAVEPVVCEGY